MKKIIYLGLIFLLYLQTNLLVAANNQQNLIQLASFKTIPIKRPELSSRLPIKRPEQPLLSLKLDNQDYEYFDLALKSADKWHWDKVKKIKVKIKNEEAKKILDWIRYYNGADDLTFTNYINFIEENSFWPLLDNVKLKAEEKISFSDDHAALLKYFGMEDPKTGWGKIYYGNSLMQNEDNKKGIRLIKEGYINGNFSRSEQQTLIKKFRSFLDQEDHKKRISDLLWNGKYRTAKSLIKYVDKDYQKLFEARIALISFSGGVDNLISIVPEYLKNNPGLQHDRLKWRIKKGKDESALELMLEVNKNNSLNIERPDKFWKLKKSIIRELINKHEYKNAYKLSINHGLSSNADIASAEWLAGWISITFLNDPATSKVHFQKIWDVSSRPISKARGSYWIGKSYAKLNDKDLSEKWFKEASRYSLTFYGQLAATELNETFNFNPILNEITEVDFKVNAELKDIYSAVSLLDEFNQSRIVKKFIIDLAENGSPPVATQAIYLSSEIERYDFAVQAGKYFYYNNVILEPKGFPTVERPIFGKIIFPDQSLIHAVIRQESQFDPKAGSSVGASGLMQLMPYTAKTVSQGLKLPYAKQKLKEDPKYNVILGSAYLDKLLSKYNGSYILSLAAYNAGESRVSSWLKKYGDPRTDDITAVDWIELIPFKETRNYVQRVTENIQVYTYLDQNNLAQPYSLNKDINRGYVGGRTVVKPALKPL